MTQREGLRLEFVKPGDPVCDEVKALYEEAFPENERKPFAELTGGLRGGGEVYAAYDGPAFIGMVSLLTLEDITHILYIAVKPELRGRGYGTAMLKLLREGWPGQRIVADLECPEEDAPNYEERKRRIGFYLRNGYCFTEISYRWEGDDYRIVSNGGNVARAEFGRFWHHFLHGDD